MKKVIVAVITAVFLLIIQTSIYAADNPAFSLGSNIPAIRGGTVTVPLNVSNNPGFATVGLVITYDPNALQITGVTAPVPAMPLNPQFTLTTSPGTQWIPLVNTNLVNWDGNGTIANITFNVSSTANLGINSITLAFTSMPDGTPGNADGYVLRNATVASGSVNVAESAAGDADYVDGGLDDTVDVYIAWYPDDSGQTGHSKPIAVDQGAIYALEIVAEMPPVADDFVEIQPVVDDFIHTPETLTEETFIGTPYTLDDVGSGPRVAQFGRVPQTGVPSIMSTVLAAGAFFTISIIMWLGIFYFRNRKEAKND